MENDGRGRIEADVELLGKTMTRVMAAEVEKRIEDQKLRTRWRRWRKERLGHQSPDWTPPTNRGQLHPPSDQGTPR